MAAASPIDYEDIQTNHPTELSQRWLSVNKADQKFSVCVAVVMLMAFLFYGRLGLLAASAVFILCMVRGENGRTYYAFGQWCYSQFWIRLVLRDTLWTAAPARNKFTGALRRSSPLALNLDILGDPEDPDEDIGLLYSPDNKTDSIVIFAEGSDIASVDLVTQHTRQTQIAEVVKRVASTPGQQVGVSYVFRRRPPDIEAQIDWDANNSHPDVLIPEALNKPEEQLSDKDQRDLFLLEGIAESWEMVATQTAAVDMAMVLTLQRSEALRLAVKGKGLKSVRDISRLPIVKVAETAIAGLTQARVTDPHVATPEEAEAYLRRTWDIKTVGEYDLARSEQGQDDLDLSVTDRQWPHNDDSSIVVKHDHCIIDGSYHGVLRITAATPNPPPNWYRQLFAVDVSWMSITLVGETLSYRGEYWMLERLIPIRSDIMSRLELGPRAQDAQESLQQRQEDIYRSRFLQNYQVLVAVGATSLERLEDDINKVIHHAGSIGFGTSRVRGRSRQVPYLLSATTGVPVNL